MQSYKIINEHLYSV